MNTDINELQRVEELALNNITDYSIRDQYCTAITSYLKTGKVTEDLVTIVIKGMDIDRGNSFLGFLSSVSSEESLKKIWKSIAECKDIYEEDSEKALKFLYAFLYSAILKEGKISSVIDKIINKINAIIIREDGSILDVQMYMPIFMDYFADELQPDTLLPEWKYLKCTPEAMKLFINNHCELEDIKKNKYLFIRVWFETGKRYVDAELERKAVEARIPKSRIDELRNLVTHYSNVELNLKESIQHEAFLEKKVDQLNGEIFELNSQKAELEKKAAMLQKEIETREQSLDKAGKEIEERKKLNQVQMQYREDSQDTLLQDIARALRPEFDDYFDTTELPISDQLGEIYREKLNGIAKILNQKGIKVGR